MSLEERRRPSEPNHVRTTEVQSLDALLRIEETLVSILEGLRHFAKQQKTSKALDELAENDADLIDSKPAPKARRK
jgi:hypothetical protein